MKDNNDNSIISGKALDRHFNFNAALFEFHNLFNVENKDERAIAILGGTFLEMALEHMLRAFLPEDEKDVNNLFENNQPLGTFSSKIQMSFCLGLIDDVIKNDLNIVRKIRNKFAHDLYANFENDQQIKSLTNALIFHTISMMMQPPDGATEIQKFQVGVNQLISHLQGRITMCRTEKRVLKRDFKHFIPNK